MNLATLTGTTTTFKGHSVMSYQDTDTPDLVEGRLEYEMETEEPQAAFRPPRIFTKPSIVLR